MNSESRTGPHKAAQDKTEISITARSTDKKFHPVFRSPGDACGWNTDGLGARVERVYWRCGSLYARVQDPLTGRERWTRSPDGSLKMAVGAVRDSRRNMAGARAQAYHDALNAVRTRREGWSIGRVLAEYPAAAEAMRAATGKPCRETQRASLSRARRIFRGHEDEPAERAPDIAFAYAAAWNRDHGGGRPTSTAHAEYSQVRGIFSAWALDAYERAGMPHAELRWRRVASPEFQYELPGRDLRERTIEAGKDELRKGTPVGRAFLLEFFCAMSGMDAALARWDWMSADGTVHYRRHKTGKPADPRLPQDVAARWRELAEKEAGGSPFVLPFRTESLRHDFLKRDFARWMRGLGWTTKKKGHELRKLMCSIWFTAPGVGAEWTQAWSGDSLQVLQKHYARLLPEKAPPPPSV